MRQFIGLNETKHKKKNAFVRQKRFFLDSFVNGY